MRTTTFGLATVVLMGLAGCDGGGGGDAGRPPVDAPRMDAPSLDDDAAGADTGPVLDDTGVDIDAPGLLDAPPIGGDGYLPEPDSSVADDAWVASDDTGSTADGGSVSECVAAGGSCVAVTPTACGRGIVSNADWYSCGRGVGVLCCLPADSPPTCRTPAFGEPGWYHVDGTLICAATCTRSSLTCENAGTRSEGWYARPASAGCSGSSLVEWANCAP